MIKAKCEVAFGGAVRSQFVRNDPFGNEAPAFHQLDQEPLWRVLALPRLQDSLKNNAVLVDGAPQPL